MPETGLIAEVLDGIGLRSASFIVTVYGDVVVPRGGVLWTGTLIDICAGVGISESLVRTAVSRLVAAHRLRGERVGRRSYYHLDASAHQEFEQAAVLLFGPEIETRGWQILHAPDLSEDAARLQRMGHMGGQVFIRPDRGQPVPEGALAFRALDPEGIERVAHFWDLSALQERYLDMIARFAPLDLALKDGTLSDEAALTARLLLVHVYRNVMLRDPRLPRNVLPSDWKGQEARALFRRLYRHLSPAAERHIAARFEGVDGYLPAQTAASEARISGL
ncbi:PaaX family transcriptional regulator [Sedimentimonas flavescens]|uniref:PaaX family transcriptional regulator n=2 Tax=Sedimentimonas flavescens TaxID=2851012 RepID=A0ABT2ZWB5_9RHOB|nr:PaaX family transcriptional regulator C-terminal domain-containing protein [Sedimentimonas flavescens]MBW0159012.1 PaaX family transcriptional regulator [Sedimentimonas flavescens]MCV2878020.1 PaaX family transcriptional regulator [Sedimentimonas flavescens]WBL33779.1 PaaX family transcriptional regulator [Sinirhodobacter sp. HNIBRBA609]